MHYSGADPREGCITAEVGERSASGPPGDARRNARREEGGPVPPAKGDHPALVTRWSEEQVARDLEKFLACADEWPSYRDFVRAGRKQLYEQARRRGGVQRWADELGVLLIRRSPGQRLSEAEIHEALRTLLRQHKPERWPSRRFFDEHGPPGLVGAMAHTGGSARWAEQLGVPRRSRPR